MFVGCFPHFSLSRQKSVHSNTYERKTNVRYILPPFLFFFCTINIVSPFLFLFKFKISHFTNQFRFSLYFLPFFSQFFLNE
ncbi:hypothetical protein LINGRAHAP2_LOCUS2203 [Linum grandiflorum]